jgi:hypothetical protein
MEIDTEKVDEAVLALLYLTLHDGARAWKGFDWETLNRLHAKGFISGPVSKAKSVILTAEGLRASDGCSLGYSPSASFGCGAPGFPGRPSVRISAMAILITKGNCN